MRLRICLNGHGIQLLINYQEHLTGAIYRLLQTSDANYSHFLHNEGYRLDNSPRTFKLFTFSWLRGKHHPPHSGTIAFELGPMEWFLASPVDEFINHAATGLSTANGLRVADVLLPITKREILSVPILSETTRFTCLSPIVASVRQSDNRVYYLRPGPDGKAFSEAVRLNLIRKHETLYGRPPADNRFVMTFDSDYLARTGGGTKLVTYKNIRHVGAFCPFTVSGSVELMRVGYETGFGEKNATGFGMVEVK